MAYNNNYNRDNSRDYKNRNNQNNRNNYNGNNTRNNTRNNQGNGNRNNSGNGQEAAENVNVTIHAPYNFVGYERTPVKRFERTEDLPRHNVISTDLKSGEIHYMLEAVTPVFISDGEADAHFYKGPDGKYQIPGSTIRGAIRENVQILGCGMLRKDEDVEDYSIFYRDVASNNKNYRTAYSNILKVNNQRVPTEIKAGYIYKKEGKYYIVEASKGYFKVSRNNEELLELYNQNIPEGDFRTVYFTAMNGKVVHITEEKVDNPLYMKGTLVSTGKPVGKYTNPLYVITEAKDLKDSILLSERDVNDYKKDYLVREKVLKPASYWALPKEEGRLEPVFYLEAAEGGRIFFGKCLFIRIPYSHSICDGIRFLEPIDAQNIFLDYVYSIFGYAGKDEAYKSRVSFEGMNIVGDEKEGSLEKVVLGEPRPSYYPGYLISQAKEEMRNYPDDDFLIRGYKQYWFQDVYKGQESENEKISSKLRPLPAGTKFKGIIRYNNLNEDELGLLLWALKVEKESYIGIGKGKPYGYGCMKPTIIGIREFTGESLYSSDLCSVPDIEDKNIPKYISAYKEYYKSTLKPASDINKNQRIKDFIFIHESFNEPDVNKSYMTLEEYKNKNKKLDTLRTIQKAKETNAEPKREAVVSGDLSIDIPWANVHGKRR